MQSQTISAEKLAEAVREKRGERARHDAADESGVPYTCLARVEKGYGLPSLENYAAICRWLGRSMDDFCQQPQHAAA